MSAKPPKTTTATVTSLEGRKRTVNPADTKPKEETAFVLLLPSLQYTGHSAKKVARIARLLAKASWLAKQEGLMLFGASTGADIRYYDRSPTAPPNGQQVIVAQINGPWSGGDGADWRTTPDGVVLGELWVNLFCNGIRWLPS